MSELDARVMRAAVIETMERREEDKEERLGFGFCAEVTKDSNENGSKMSKLAFERAIDVAGGAVECGFRSIQPGVDSVDDHHLGGLSPVGGEEGICCGSLDRCGG